MGKLHDALLQNDKKGIFAVEDRSLMGYATGFMPLDYQNGYLLSVTDKDHNVTNRWANAGLFGGSIRYRNR